MLRSTKLILAGAFLTWLPVVIAAEPGLSDRFYQAIRSDDAAALAELLKSGADVNTRDNRGTTPAMHAAAIGTPAMLRRLMAAGADVNARNSFDATALMWCTNQVEKVRMLLDGGADVNARSKPGRTPLLIAATHEGNLEVVRMLIEKGADLAKARDAAGNSPLLASAMANDIAMARFLIERGADVNAANADKFTPLMFAAAHGNAAMTRYLLSRGADVNARTGPSFGRPVRKGPIALGNLTPLLFAATAANAETVRVLLEAGADVNAKDVRGMTPLMLAVATDHPDQEMIRLLMARNPDLKMQSNVNETVLAWAAKFRHPSVMAALKAPAPRVRNARGIRPVAHTVPPDTREAVGKSIALMQRAGAVAFKEGGCMSCHSHNITTMAVAIARPKGVSLDLAAAAETAKGTRLQFAAFAEGLLERLDPPATEILTYAMTALVFDRAEPDRTTDALVHNLAAQQHSDGSWGFPGIVRPPMMDQLFSVTATAILALRQYAPPARRAEMEQRVAKAARWLLETEPRTTEDRVMQILGVTWAGADAPTRAALARRLAALQREDGGWAQIPTLHSDAYATGTALYALHESGHVRATDTAYRKGVRYLLRTQAADGSWHVASRAPKFQPYFEGGFPYGHDQWISQMATGWASISLSLSIPDALASR